MLHGCIGKDYWLQLFAATFMVSYKNAGFINDGIYPMKTRTSNAGVSCVS